MPYTVTVTPAIVWTDTTPATAANLNLASTPIMSLSGSGDGSTSALGAGSVTPTMLTEDARHDEAQYAASIQGTDTYVIALPVTLVSYTVGMVVRFKADVANTGAATLNVDGRGAKALVSRKGAALADNDIAASAIVTCVYDGTNFQVLEVTPASSITAAMLATDAVETLKIKDANVTTSKILDANVTLPKLTATGGTAKATPIAADKLVLFDSAASDAPKTVTVSALQAATGVVYATTENALVEGPVIDEAHGLGAKPRWVRAVLVAQAGAELGYTAGDELDAAGLQNDNDDQIIHFGASATNVFAGCRNVAGATGGVITLQINHKTTGIDTAATPTLWKLKVYAML
jgi:hypothetical protein